MTINFDDGKEKKLFTFQKFMFIFISFIVIICVILFGYNYFKMWEKQNNLNVIIIDGKKLELGKILGRGMYGQATLAIRRDTKEKVVVKQINPQGDTEHKHKVDSLICEQDALQHIGRHPNIVTLLFATNSSSDTVEPMLVLEYCKYGSIYDFSKAYRKCFVDLLPYHQFLHQHQQQSLHQHQHHHQSLQHSINEKKIEITPSECPLRFDTNMLLQWAVQVSNGMKHLHSRTCNFIHVDIATRNVLIDSNGVAKICDFGLAREVFPPKFYYRKQSECPIPIKYLAPESILNAKYTKFSDVWSFGVFLWELFALGDVFPHSKMPWKDLYTWLQQGNRLTKPYYAPYSMYNNVIAKCWQFDERLRPTFAELYDVISTMETSYTTIKKYKCQQLQQQRQQNENPIYATIRKMVPSRLSVVYAPMKRESKSLTGRYVSPEELNFA